MKIRLFFLVISILLLISCSTIKIDPFDLSETHEVEELDKLLYNYKDENGKWPTDSVLDSLRESNNFLRHFSKILLTNNSDSSLKIDFKLEYSDFENSYRTLEMIQELKRYGI